MPISQFEFNLKPYNTFGIECYAERYCEVQHTNDLKELILSEKLLDQKHLILGGGSNVLFTSNFAGLVINNSIQGIEISDSNDDYFIVKAGAGVVWHDLVLYSLEQNLGGIENLSLIPGKCGAAPIQNIGAYGVELKDSFYSLQALDKKSGELHEFNSRDCEFGYRNSIFKNKAKGQFIITSISLKLHRNPKLNLEYGAIQQTLEDLGIQNPNIQDVSRAVINIRQSKLPDPRHIGNAGSFFKNPVLNLEVFNTLKEKHPGIPSYPVSDDEVKVPAAWLIDQAGWKGKTFGTYGVHIKQALVLVNYGGAKGSEISELASKIQNDVLQKFGVKLEPEVTIIN